jgi:hypothetical protein
MHYCMLSLSLLKKKHDLEGILTFSGTIEWEEFWNQRQRTLREMERTWELGKQMDIEDNKSLEWKWIWKCDDWMFSIFDVKDHRHSAKWSSCFFNHFSLSNPFQVHFFSRIIRQWESKDLYDIRQHLGYRRTVIDIGRPGFPSYCVQSRQN